MIKKIKVTDLKKGMFISDMNAPYTDHPFLTNTRRVKGTGDVEQLIKHHILEVYIDTSKGIDSKQAVSAEEVGEQIRKELREDLRVDIEPEEDDTPGEMSVDMSKELAGFREELHKAKEVYGEAKVMVNDLLQEARLGKSVDGERAQQAVSGMVDSIFRDQNALLTLSKLKSYDNYTFQHSLNVSVLSLALGRSLGLVKDELRRLGVGAILHDIGKMLIPEEILNKPGKYTDEEFAIMKSHPLEGAKLLMAAENVEEECSAVALNHHERFSGRGYPRGLQGMSIGKFGLISSIVDVYDAITSDRCYHNGIPSYQAIQKIYEWGKTDFYPVYVQKFIQCLGVYPVGTLVQLDTWEVGVVYSQNHNDLLRPWLRLIRDASGEPLFPYKEIDLREPDPRDSKEHLRTIKQVLPEEAAGVDVQMILGVEGAEQ